MTAALRAVLTLNNKGFMTGMVSASKSVGKFGRVSAGIGTSVAKSFGKAAIAVTGLGAAIAGVIAIASGGSLIKQAFGDAADWEQAQTAFEVLLKDGKAATKLLQDLEQFNLETPFEAPEVTEAAKKLLAYGFSAKTITDDLKLLGNVAAGVQQPLSEIAYLYGTIKTAGRAYSKDIYQFAGRGIPIMEALAAELKTSKDQVLKLASEGKVGFKEIEGAFKRMSKEGGPFFKMMEKQSMTGKGLMSNISDAFGKLSRAMGQPLLESAKPVMQVMMSSIPKLVPYAKAFGDLIVSGAKTAWKYIQMIVGVFQSGGIGDIAQAALGNAFGAAAEFLQRRLEASAIWLGEGINYGFERAKIGAARFGEFIVAQFDYAAKSFVYAMKVGIKSLSGPLIDMMLKPVQALQVSFPKIAKVLGLEDVEMAGKVLKTALSAIPVGDAPKFSDSAKSASGIFGGNKEAQAPSFNEILKGVGSRFTKRFDLPNILSGMEAKGGKAMASLIGDQTKTPGAYDRFAGFKYASKGSSLQGATGGLSSSGLSSGSVGGNAPGGYHKISRRSRAEREAEKRGGDRNDQQMMADQTAALNELVAVTRRAWEE